MYKLIIISLFTITLSLATAAEKEDLNSLMHDYLMGLGSANKKLIQKVTTDKYIKKLNKNKTLEMTFAKNKNFNKKKVDFDMKYQRGARNTELIYINIKNKDQKEYGDYWYVVKKVDNKYLIDDMVFWD